MLASGFILRTSHHFQVAQHNRLPVEVWQQGHILDYGGPIESFTDTLLTINGAKYPRGACEFRVR